VVVAPASSWLGADDPRPSASREEGRARGRFNRGGTGTSDLVRAVTKADIFATCVGVLSLVAGVVLLVVVEGTLASTVGAALLGLAGIAFVALVFLLVGESEDRDRRNGAL
jgi:hypothetical protein